jgi:hypothetical protein
MFSWLGHAFTLLYGLGALAFGLLNIWLWARGGFRFPRYIHVMAFFALLLGWALEQATAEAGVPPPKGGALTAVLLLLAFPALVYGAFVFVGGATGSDDRGGNNGLE